MVSTSSGTRVDTSEHAINPAIKDLQPVFETASSIPNEDFLVSNGLLNKENGNVKRRTVVIKARKLMRLQDSLAVGLALGGLFVGYFAWRLSEGSVSIAIAKPLVETQLSKIIGGQATINELRLSWDQYKREFVITADQITARTPARKAPLTLGSVDLTLDARSFFQGRVQINRSNLSGLSSVLVVDQKGQTAFGFGDAQEVLALPRKRNQPRSLQQIFAALRTAMWTGGQAPRVGMITLKNAELLIIDPETEQRLTLSNMTVIVETKADQSINVIANGTAKEMSAPIELRIASGTHNDDPILASASWQNARLSMLPSSLKVGSLARFRNDTIPLTGTTKAVFGAAILPNQIEAQVRAGQGTFQGSSVSNAGADLAYDGNSKEIRVRNINVRGPIGEVNAGSFQLKTENSGARTFSFDAKALKGVFGYFGNINGTTVQGAAQFDRSNLLRSAVLSGKSIGLSGSRSRALSATDYLVRINRSTFSSRPDFWVNLQAQRIAGAIENNRLLATDIVAQARVTQLGQKFSLAQGTARSARLDSVLQLRGVTQPFNINDLDVEVERFGGPQNTLPDRLRLRARDVDLGKQSASLVGGRANGVDVDVSGLAEGAGRAIGSFANLEIEPQSGQGIQFSGQQITFDLNHNNLRDVQLNQLNASRFAVGFKGNMVGITSLVASGTLKRNQISNARISAQTAQIDSPAQLVRPFWAENLRLVGNFAPRSFSLNSFALRHKGVDIVGDTQIVLSNVGSPKVDLNADVTGPFTVETLLAAWPKRFLPETRENIRRLVPEGTAEVSQLALAIPAGMRPKQILPKSGLDLDFDLRDVTITYLNGMSAITNVSGRGRLTGNSLKIDLPFGSIGDFVLTDGAVEIPEFKRAGAEALIKANIAGRVSEISQELDLPPLGIFAKAGFDRARLDGEGHAQLSLNIPLKRRLQPNDIGVEVDGEFQQARMKRVFAGLDATDGTVSLRVFDRSIEVFGDAQIANSVFDFVWTSAQTETAPEVTTLQANGEISVETLKTLKIDATSFAQGPIQINVMSNSQGEQLGAAVVTAELTNTNIRLPGDVWQKPSGVEAQASANIYPREGGGWNVQDLRFNAGDALLRGALDVSDQGQLVDARFSRIFIPNAADLSVNVTPSAAGIVAGLRGPYLNLSPFLAARNVSSQAVDLFDRPLTLSADISLVATAPDSALTNVHADIIRDAIGWRTLSASGDSGVGSSKIDLKIQRDGRRSISGVLSDAGFFAKLLYPGAPLSGGTGIIEGELPVVGANSSGSLNFTGKDIRLVRQGAAPIKFDTIQLPMSVQGGVVSLRDGQADSAAYTVKANGYVDVGAGRLDIRGVATPGGLNRALGEIPLFGALLGGGNDEGLLGITFTAKGSLSAPRLITNPISALAPGFLRKLFESDIPISPQPRLVVTSLAGDPALTKWPYGPFEDMSETHVGLVDQGQTLGSRAIGPVQ